MRLSKNGKLKEERTYQQFRVKNQLVPSFKGEFSSNIEILIKMLLPGEKKFVANKFQYEWIAKDYDSANRNTDFLIAFSEVCSGENIRKFLSDHPKARLILEHRKNLHETAIIPHTILKRIDFFNQLERVYIPITPILHAIKIPQFNGEKFQEYTINNNGKFVSSTGKEITLKNLASLAMFAWYHYEKDPHGRNYGVKPICSDDEQMFFFKVDNTRSIWTLDPRHYARPNKTEKEHETLSKCICTNWFLDKLEDYMPDHFFFYKMDPRILASNNFKQEMHETILSILEDSSLNTMNLIKSHFPQQLFIEKSDDESEVSDFSGSEQDNTGLDNFNAKQFVTQIVRIILCLVARKNQLLQWVCNEPEFIAFLQTKGKSVSQLSEIVNQDNKLFIQKIFSETSVLSDKKENIIPVEKQILQADVIPLTEVNDLFKLPGFPTVLIETLLDHRFMPRLGLSWGAEKNLAQRQTPVSSPLSSPIKSLASPDKGSLTYSPQRSLLQNNETNSSQLSGSLPNVVLSPKASPSKNTNAGIAQQHPSPSKRGTLFSASPSKTSSSPHHVSPSCKHDLLEKRSSQLEKRPRLAPTDLLTKFGF